MSQWELLVTEGHVRAERWRNAVPFVFGMSVLAVVLGMALQMALPHRAPPTHAAESRQSYAERLQSGVSDFVADKGRVARQPEQPELALNRATAPANVAAILATLNAGGLSNEVEVANADDFWSGAWTAGRVHAVRTQHNVLVGFYVNTTYGYAGLQPQIQRAYGLFHQGADRRWTLYCLSIRESVCEGAPSLDPATIPATMRDLIPSRAFAREERS